MQRFDQARSTPASTNGSHGDVLHWEGRLLTADRLRESLNGHREIHVGKKTLVSPLVLDELRDRGVRLVRTSGTSAQTSEANKNAGGWGYSAQAGNGLVESVVAALARDGVTLARIEPSASIIDLARRIASGAQAGIVAFCEDAALVCCLANKVAGVRGANVFSVAQAKRIVKSLAPNFVAIELPGPTFFELKQIVRTLCVANRPDEVTAGTIRALEATDAHR